MIKRAYAHHVNATQVRRNVHLRLISSLCILGFIVVLSSLLSGCSLPESPGSSNDTSSTLHLRLRQPEDLEPVHLLGEDRLQVVASTSIVADVASNIGGENLEVTVLIPRGIDPHAYQPTPGDLKALYQADLVMLNGFDLEVALEDELGSVSNSVPIISLSDGLEALTFEIEAAQSNDHDVHDEGLDPHVWFDPTLVIHWVDRVELALVQLDPTHAPDFQINAIRYRGELTTLDGWIKEQVASIPLPKRKLVLDHLVLGYFAERYGFEVVSALVPAFSSAAQVSPRELATLTEVIRAEAVSAIFVGADTNSRMAEQLAHDLDIDVIRLYTSSLSEVGGAAETYIEMMQYNVLAMRQALMEEA